jgi:hypothetical protein
MGSLKPLEDNRSVNTVRCPLSGAIYDKSFKGTVCQTSGITTLGSEVLGLNIVL